jgi:hypothetical protein
VPFGTLAPVRGVGTTNAEQLSLFSATTNYAEFGRKKSGESLEQFWLPLLSKEIICKRF